MTPRDIRTDAQETVLVWDPLVRVFHWSLATAFFSAYLLGEDGGALHRNIGYAALGLVAVRMVWGLIGTRHARFSDFVPSPVGLMAYVKEVLRGREKRYLGHNPAGGAMIVALLAMIIGTGATGWLMTTDAFWGSDWMEEIHETLANGALLLVGLHLGGVLFSSLRHRENLVRAMLTGRKRRD